MSYIVLARKWRPQNFDDLVGQESVVKTFKNAISSNKIVHAYLFSGPRGVGKTSSARILAKALNCKERAGSEPCGKCASCESITSGSSVDVMEIDGASNTSVDSIRELREAVKYAPSGGKYKIYIIDEVHMLSTAAFNALLKTLEEPPEHVIFIFATTEAKKIPSTILSRCQHHSFRRVSKAEIKGHLKKITDTEGINIQDSALEMIAKAADGSMRDSLTLLDQACSFSDEITGKELQGLLGLPETETITNLSKNILSGDISNTLTIIKELTDRGSDLRQLTKALVEYFRNIAVVKITTDAEGLLEFSAEETQALRDISADVNIEQLTLLLTEMLKLEGEVRNAINPRYTLELGLLRTSFVKGMTSIDNIMKMLGNPDSAPSAPVKNISSPASPAPAAPPVNHIQAPVTPNPSTMPVNTIPEPETPVYSAPPVNDVSADAPIEKKTEIEPTPPAPSNSSSVTDKDELWKTLINIIDADDHRLSLKLSEARPVRLTEAELSIGFSGGMSFLADSIKSKSSIIKPLLKKISGRYLDLKIVALPKEEVKKKGPDLKEKIINEPLVSDALRVFGGSVVKVRSLGEE